MKHVGNKAVEKPSAAVLNEDAKSTGGGWSCLDGGQPARWSERSLGKDLAGALQIVSYSFFFFFSAVIFRCFN